MRPATAADGGAAADSGSETVVLAGAAGTDASGDAVEGAMALAACPADFPVPPTLSIAPDRTNPSVDARVRTLISVMTSDEKAQQLGNTTPSIDRLNLPAYQYWSEALHGVMASGTTSFPVPLGLGATWDPSLVHEVASAISDEARALANTKGAALTYFSPTINIVRDPRWGRAEESYSEDPHLLSRMAVAYVTGFQGDHPQYFKAIATAKHFLANNYEAGRTSTSSDIDERALREYYEPHFKAAVTEARVYSIMAAYNAVNGIPMVDQQGFLSDLLRGEWGFHGYVVSDCGAIAYSYTDHHYLDSYTSAAARALISGTDLECVSGEKVYQDHLGEALSQGLVSEPLLDESLLRVLRGRFLLGEFDAPESVPYQDLDQSVVDSAAHHDLAQRAAEQSMVLLENTSNLLPLDPSTSSIAVLGPYADVTVLGGYSGTPTSTVSVLAGIRERLPDADVLTSTSSAPEDLSALASQAAVAVVVLGTDQGFASEGSDAPDLELPNGQEDIARAVIEANPRSVVVLMAGHPVTFRWIKEHAPAILYGFYAGQQGGAAVARVLFGDVNPGGKLPLTLYASADQLPSITNYAIRGDDPGGIGRTYLYYDESQQGSVLYPFGYGLSYSSFTYQALEVCRSDPKTLWISVRVTNSSQRSGDEVVQLYVHESGAQVTRPRRELRGFRRVSVQPGATETVSFRLDFDDLGPWNPEAGRFMLAPGQLQLELGSSSQDIRLRGVVRVESSGFLL